MEEADLTAEIARRLAVVEAKIRSLEEDMKTNLKYGYRRDAYLKVRDRLLAGELVHTEPPKNALPDAFSDKTHSEMAAMVIEYGPFGTEEVATWEAEHLRWYLYLAIGRLRQMGLEAWLADTSWFKQFPTECPFNDYEPSIWVL